MKRIGLGAILVLLLAACGTTEPQVGSWVGSVSFTPEHEAVDVPVDTDIVITYEFSDGTDPIGVSEHNSTFTVVPQNNATSALQGAEVSGATQLNEEAGQLIFDPADDLEHDTTYQVTVEGSVTTTEGEEFTGVTSWSFTTAGDIIIGGPDGGGPITIDDSPRGTPTVPVDNGTDSEITVGIVCEDDKDIEADGFSLDPGTAEAATTADQTVVADLDVVEDGTYTCTITAKDDDTTATEEVTVIVDTSGDGTGGGGDGDGNGDGDEPGFDLPTNGGNIDVGDDDTGETDLDVGRDGGHDGLIDFTYTCPVDIELAFDPNPVAGGIDQTTVTATVGSGVSNGSYDCTVTGTDTVTRETDDSTVTVDVNRTVEALSLPDDGTLDLTIDDSNQGSVDFVVERLDGFDGQLVVGAKCTQAGLQVKSLSADSGTTDGYTLTVSLENPENGLSNGTYPAACEITAGAEGSSNATTTVDVIVGRTIGDFQLPGSDGSGITVTIDDDNTPTVVRALSIARGKKFGDTTVGFGVTCDEFGGISGSVNPTSTSEDSTDLAVTAVEGLDNGTYENACEVQGTATHKGETVTSTTLVTVEVARTVVGIDFSPTGVLTFDIDDTSNSDTETIKIERTNGFTGEVDVTGSCVTEDENEPGITFDPVTIAEGENTAQVAAHAERGVDNNTDGYACELTGTADLSEDATIDATVVVERTFDEFGLLNADDLSIYVGNDGNGLGTLQIGRDGILEGVDLDLSSGQCDAGITMTHADSTDGDAALSVTVDNNVESGTYSCEVTVTNDETGESETATVEIVVQQFSLGADAVSVSYDEGQSDSGTLEIVRDGSASFDVAIEVSCDDGITVDPSSPTLTGSGTLTYDFEVSGGNGGESYTCTIEASTQDGDSNTLDTEQATLSILVEEEQTTPECELASFTIQDNGEYGNVWYYDKEPQNVVPAGAVDLGWSGLTGSDAAYCDANADVRFELHAVSPGNSPLAFFAIDADTGAIDKIDNSDHAPDRKVKVEATSEGESVFSNDIVLRNAKHNPPE